MVADDVKRMDRVCVLLGCWIYLGAGYCALGPGSCIRVPVATPFAVLAMVAY